MPSERFLAIRANVAFSFILPAIENCSRPRFRAVSYMIHAGIVFAAAIALHALPLEGKKTVKAITDC